MKKLICSLTLFLSFVAMQAQADVCAYAGDMSLDQLRAANKILKGAVITSASKDPVGLEQGKLVELIRSVEGDAFRPIISITGEYDGSINKVYGDYDLAQLLIICKGDKGEDVLVNLAGALKNSGVPCTNMTQSIPHADRDAKCAKVK